MMNVRIIALIICCACTASVFGQSAKNLLLSNHTYTKNNPVIGIISGGSGNASYRVKGSAAKIFELKGDTLSIRAVYAGSDKSYYDAEIEATGPTGTFSSSFRFVNDRFIANKVIAHRGAWKNTGAAENSIKALEQAIRLGCQGSEFDVHMSADSVLVINHDPAIQGLTIATSPAKQLSSLKLSSGESMPTLEAYLRAGMKQNSTKLVLEIKPTTSPERAVQLARRVVSLVQQMKAQAWIDYISFDYVICKEVMRLDPFARVAYLNGDKTPEQLKSDGLWGYDYHFSVLKKNEAWIEQARNSGLTTNVWTVNDAASLQWFLDRKIDFITTNEPELLLKMVAQ